MTEARNMRKIMESIKPVAEHMDEMPVDNMGAMDNNGDMGEYDPNGDMGGEMPDMDGMGGDINGTAEYVGDEMAGEVPAVSTEIIDALEGEFKRLTTDFLQTGGELDEAGLGDIREKLGKHMTSILDVLHAGWMDNMMDQAGGGDEGGSDGGDDVPDFIKGDDDSDDSDSDDSDSEDKDDDSDDSDDKSDDSDDDDSDDSDDDKEDDDSDDKGDDYNFEEAHLNESLVDSMKRMQKTFLKG